MGTENDWSDCMTVEQMNDVIQGYCVTTVCGECKVVKPCSRCSGNFKLHPMDCEEAYTILTESNSAPNSVNHPNHYNRENSIECIDEMILVFGKEAVKQFCLCNIWKYRYRASDKNGEEDLKKSDWYMQKYKELCSNE